MNAGLPSREDLLLLVARSEQRALTWREAHLLRLGLVALAARAAAAEIPPVRDLDTQR